jgi:hypothetical protein
LPALAEPCNGVPATVPDVTLTGGGGVAAKWPEAHDRKYSCPAALQPTSTKNIQDARHTMQREPAMRMRARLGWQRGEIGRERSSGAAHASSTAMNTVANGVNNYAGPERRRYKVFVTHNSQYHCRDGVCVAVLSRRTGDFVRDHVVLGGKISGSVTFNPLGAIATTSGPETPRIGEQLCFAMRGSVEGLELVITSRLRSVERPRKDTVMTYTLADTLH